jgi:hypothetical protein
MVLPAAARNTDEMVLDVRTTKKTVDRKLYGRMLERPELLANDWQPQRVRVEERRDAFHKRLHVRRL